MWTADTLFLPSCLASEYLLQLNKLGLKGISTEISAKKDIHGGKTREETMEHFARRFAVCAGRIEYASLGPSDPFSTVSDAMLSSLSDGNIAILDIPCGTGAIATSIVCTLIELRKYKILAKLPLSIHICGGDFSLEARTLCGHLLEALQPHAASEGIELSWRFVDWDGTRSDHTARLMDEFLANTTMVDEYLVTVGNFSGALNNGDSFDKFSRCFEQILGRLHDKRSTVVWVEPASGTAKKSLMKRLAQFMASRIPWLIPSQQGTAQPVAEAHYRFSHPVNGALFPTSVVLQHFVRN